MLDDTPDALEPGRTDDVLFAERAVLGSVPPPSGCLR